MENANADCCPFCRGRSLNAFKPMAHDAPAGSGHRVSIVECRDCVAAWQYPVARNADESRDTFDAAYNSADGGYFDPAKRRAISELQRSFIEARMPVGDLLDVGCGDGSFARTMAAAGWRATGLDPAMPEKDRTAPGDDGPLQLIRGSLDDLPADRRFDLVTLWDVVEHLDHPTGLLTALAARLKPGGSLIMETGNYQSAGRIESGETWWNYQLDHRWYFAPPQLEALAREAGLEPVEWARQVLRPWWKGAPSSQPPGLGGVVKSLARGPQAFARARHRHAELTAAAQRWPHWSGLEIVTLQARRPA